jgi:hypothetical protein
MHYGSARVSTDDQNTALQRAVLKRGRMHDDLHGRRSFRCDPPALCPHPLPHSPPVNVATGMCRACPPGRSHPWCVTHLGRGARARERVTQAVDSWSGVLGRDSDTPRTGDAAVAGPPSPVPLARRAHPLVPPVRRSRVPRRLSCEGARVRGPPAGVNTLFTCHRSCQQ